MHRRLITVRPTAGMMNFIFGQMAGISCASSTCTDGHFAPRRTYNLAMCAFYSYGEALCTHYWMHPQYVLCLRSIWASLNNMAMHVLNCLNNMHSHAWFIDLPVCYVNKAHNEDPFSSAYVAPIHSHRMRT